MILRVHITLKGAKPKRFDKIKFVGQMSFYRLCRQLDFIAIDGTFRFAVENGMILSVRIVGRANEQGQIQE